MAKNEPFIKNSKQLEFVGNSLLSILKSLIPEKTLDIEFGISEDRIGTVVRFFKKTILNVDTEGAKYVRKIREYEEVLHFSFWHTIENEKIYEETTKIEVDTEEIKDNKPSQRILHKDEIIEHSTAGSEEITEEFLNEKAKKEFSR